MSEIIHNNMDNLNVNDMTEYQLNELEKAKKTELEKIKNAKKEKTKKTDDKKNEKVLKYYEEFLTRLEHKKPITIPMRFKSNTRRAYTTDKDLNWGSLTNTDQHTKAQLWANQHQESITVSHVATLEVKFNCVFHPNPECPVCLNNKPLIFTSCGHKVCKECLKELKKVSNTCPICRKKLTKKI